jgi:predicted TIM-barrel fold metal-dependent hydrolase
MTAASEIHAPHAPHDEVIRPLLDAAARALPGGTTWFDAHTHIGHNDPDGFEADPEEILAGLDNAGQHKAMLFPMHEPGGYREANDWVIETCRQSGGRLTALARVAPSHEDAVAEARRSLAAGAAGIKLHPRSDDFRLPHPAVTEVVSLVAERGGPVLFHAGRGIPHLGEAVIELCRAYPGAKIILAHAGISELGWITPAARELPNLFFDTAWWQVADLLALYATVPAGQILYASDLPYGSGLFHAFAFLRCAAAVGLSRDAQAAIAGASLERLLAGEAPLDLGPPPGVRALGGRDLGFERAVTYLGVGCQMGWRGLDPVEPLSLARLALQRIDDHPVAAATDALVANDLDRLAHGGGEEEAPAHVVLYGALAGQILCGTPNALVP